MRINGRKDKNLWTKFRREVYLSRPELSLSEVYAYYLKQKAVLLTEGKYVINKNVYEVGGEPDKRKYVSRKHKKVPKK